ILSSRPPCAVPFTGCTPTKTSRERAWASPWRDESWRGTADRSASTRPPRAARFSTSRWPEAGPEIQRLREDAPGADSPRGLFGFGRMGRAIRRLASEVFGTRKSHQAPATEVPVPHLPEPIERFAKRRGRVTGHV